MQYFDKTNIDFIGPRKFFGYLSTFLTVGGVILVIIFGIQLGIDFKGGAELAVQINTKASTSEVRASIEKAGLHNAEVKSYGEENQYLIRVDDIETGSARALEAIKKDFGTDNFTVLKVDKIGPKIGTELFMQAIYSVLISVVLILLYIAFRFEFIYGLGAIIALVHDVTVTFCIIVVVNHFGLINLELNQQILAAMLTVIGYSINDTVIIFDRIRENLERHKGMNYIKLVNLSINETLSRTINTVATVVLVLLTLTLFGGPVLKGFAFTMLLGIVFGTYSSIYIASSSVIYYLEKIKKVDFSDENHPKSIHIAGTR